MSEPKAKTGRVREGYQPSGIEKKGYQPQGSTGRGPGTPPSGGSNVTPPKKSDK
jgi:hypothetical protein